MADTIRYGSGVFKDAEGNIVYIQGLTENDVTKIKTYHGKVDTLENLVKAANAGQRMLAYKDYYTNGDTLKTEMAPNVYYLVPFNAQSQFLEFDLATGKPKNPQSVAETTDLKVSYYEIVYKTTDETVVKLGRQNADASMEHVLYDNVNETITGEYTFEKDVIMTATQDVTALADNKLATAKFVRDSITKNITEAGHLTGRYSNTDIDEGQLVANQIVFVAAKNLVA